ncbi:MAG: SRPBCC family protein [Acidobacteriota bacterium]|nr:SRPBCC family protein [Acidobacteriota bacterium]
MAIIKFELTVNAPVKRVFDLARCIDLHEATMSKHKEKAIGGVTKGLIGMGESVTWEATHFGIKQKLTSKITAFERPKHFRDSMVKGAFRRFDHDHFFEQSGEQTLMKDVFGYDSPLGMLGKIADALFLEKYMRKMLAERNRLIKTVAESEDWRKFLNGTPSS